VRLPRNNMDKAKFDEIVLAMLWYNRRASGWSWKGFDWESTDRIFRAGMISNPASKRKSIDLSEDGERQGEAAFARHFGKL
jgi:hypothetical protein